MSSRMLDSTGSDCCGRLISSRRLGRVGSWARADATPAADIRSIAIPIASFIGQQILSFPPEEVHSGEPGPPDDRGCEGRLFSLCCVSCSRMPRRANHEL